MSRSISRSSTGRATVGFKSTSASGDIMFYAVLAIPVIAIVLGIQAASRNHRPLW